MTQTLYSFAQNSAGAKKAWETKKKKGLSTMTKVGIGAGIIGGLGGGAYLLRKQLAKSGKAVSKNVNKGNPVKNSNYQVITEGYSPTPVKMSSPVTAGSNVTGILNNLQSKSSMSPKLQSTNKGFGQGYSKSTPLVESRPQASSNALESTLNGKKKKKQQNSSSSRINTGYGNYGYVRN